MNKFEFMNVLSTDLKRLPEADKADVLYDYEEHFTIGLEQGKSEEEIAKALGDPRAIAKQFNVDTMLEQAAETKSVGNITRAVFAIAGLGFFNLVFVLGPYIGLVAVLIALFASAFALTISGIAIILTAIAAPALPDFISLGGINPGVIIFSGIGITALGLLFFQGVIALSRVFFRVTVSYLKMNLKIINK